MLASNVWVPRDVSMTSPSDMWVQSVCAADMWVPVNGQYWLGPNWALVGSGWAGLGRADPDTWHAATLPRRSRGLLLGCGPQAWSTVDASSRSMDPTQGPWWTKSTYLFSGWVHVYQVHAQVVGEGGCSPVFPAAVLLPAASSLRASCGSASFRLGRGKASPDHGDHVGGV